MNKLKEKIRAYWFNELEAFDRLIIAGVGVCFLFGYQIFSLMMTVYLTQRNFFFVLWVVIGWIFSFLITYLMVIHTIKKVLVDKNGREQEIK